MELLLYKICEKVTYSMYIKQKKKKNIWKWIMKINVCQLCWSMTSPPIQFSNNYSCQAWDYIGLNSLEKKKKTVWQESFHLVLFELCISIPLAQSKVKETLILKSNFFFLQILFIWLTSISGLQWWVKKIWRFFYWKAFDWCQESVVKEISFPAEAFNDYVNIHMLSFN